MLVKETVIQSPTSAGLPVTFADNVRKYTVNAGGVLEVTHADGTTETIELGMTVMERPNLMQRLSATNFGIPENLADLGVTPQEVLTELQGAARNKSEWKIRRSKHPTSITKKR